MPRSNTTMLSNVHVYNTLIPYNIIERPLIQYTTCRDFDYISRYKGLRQIVHNPNEKDRFIALELPNPFSSNLVVNYHEVKTVEENRLDIIAYNELGSANYAWVIAYFNGIEDGYSCHPGQLLQIPASITDLFNTGELLATVSAVNLNLGSE
ncbi:MAG: hypothetical protein LUC17_01265 [Oscillospiraceae bacterium]|nr:hypothetical protein [Oscillospiraceae bacterium]